MVCWMQFSWFLISFFNNFLSIITRTLFSRYLIKKKHFKLYSKTKNMIFDITHSFAVVRDQIISQANNTYTIKKKVDRQEKFM